MRYELTLGKNALIVPALILPGLVMTALLVLLLEHMPMAAWGEWGVLAVSLVFFTVVAVLTLRLVGMTSCRVAVVVAEDGLSFHFLKSNLFHRKDFGLTYADILNIGEDNDKGVDFLHFTTTKPGYRKFHLAASENDEAFGAFRACVLDKVASYNSTVVVPERITDRTIYQKWPMKLLAGVLVAFWFVYPVASVLLGAPWLSDVKYWVLVVMSMPIVGKVYAQNFR